MIAPTYFGPPGPSTGSLCRMHRLPDDGPGGPKYLGAVVR